MPLFLWTQRQDIGPRARAGHTAAYDAGRHRTVLFGGIVGDAVVGDTWEWTGELWTQVGDTGPAAREGATLAYETGRQHSVLFGGGAGKTLFADTWRWNGSDWTQLADTGPPARARHGAAHDPSRDRTVLFGGESGGGSMGDTWEWDGGQWTQVEEMGPSPRFSHAMTHDPIRGSVLLFGGAESDGSTLVDTWSWDGSKWTQMADTGPDARAGAAMAHIGGDIVLFGGIDSLDQSKSGAHTLFGDTWSWDGSHWTQVQDIGPTGRWRHTMTYESAEKRIMLFGGASLFAPPDDPSISAGLLGDTWVHAASETDAEGPVEPETGVEGPVVPEIGASEELSVTEVAVMEGSLDYPGASVKVVFKLSGPAPSSGLGVETRVMFIDQGGGTTPPPPGLIYTPLSVFVAPGLEGWTFDVVRGIERRLADVYLIEVSVISLGEEAPPTAVARLPRPKNPGEYLGGWEWTTT